MIINLGDSVYGPLDPLETIEILMSSEMIHIKGNCDACFGNLYKSNLLH